MRCRSISKKRSTSWRNHLDALEEIYPSYSLYWKSIIKPASRIDNYLNNGNYNINYDEDIPKMQSFLTSSENCINKEIDWSYFFQNPSSEINSRSLFDSFQGILQYIYFISENKFNTNQLEIHYSRADERTDLNIQSNNINDKCDITSIFDYKNTSTYFQIPFVINGYFGITFKKIKINPLCYSIRSDNSKDRSPHLDSFSFEGYDEELKRWDVLDERININDLIPPGGYGLYYVKTTKKSYSSFIIRQIDPAHNGMWGFSIAAFEIHGTPQVCENKECFFPKVELCTNESYNEDSLIFNPCIEISQFL